VRKMYPGTKRNQCVPYIEVLRRVLLFKLKLRILRTCHTHIHTRNSPNQSVKSMDR